MIVAITGGTGFIGRRLVQRHLDIGDVVRVLSRRPPHGACLPKGVALFRGDLAANELSSLLSFVKGADILYHCAGEISVPTRMHAIHVTGTRKLIETADRRIGRWIQLSSVGVYGPRSDGIVTEETELNPVGVYEVTKAKLELLVADASTQNSFAYVILRPSIVYGPGMKNQSLIQLFAMINRGLFFFIGRPGAVANYIHVDNVVEGLVRCATFPAAESKVYNMSDHRTYEEFSSVIASAFGRNPPRCRLPEKPVRLAARLLGKVHGFPLTESRVDALVNRAVYSSDRIRRELGYEYPVRYEDGLRKFARDWKRSV